MVGVGQNCQKLIFLTLKDADNYENAVDTVNRCSFVTPNEIRKE